MHWKNIDYRWLGPNPADVLCAGIWPNFSKIGLYVQLALSRQLKTLWTTRLSSSVYLVIVEGEWSPTPWAQTTIFNFLFWIGAWREKSISVFLLWKWKQRRLTSFYFFQSSVTHPKVVIIDSEWLLTLLYKIGWKSLADMLKTAKKFKKILTS